MPLLNTNIHVAEDEIKSLLWWSGNKCCCGALKKDTTNTNSGNDSENPKCTAKRGTCANKYKHTCMVRKLKSNLLLWWLE